MLHSIVTKFQDMGYYTKCNKDMKFSIKNRKYIIGLENNWRKLKNDIIF